MEYKFSINLSFEVLLTILFVILKTNNIIKWSWIWVFSPLWITGLIVILVIMIALIKKGLRK